MPPAIINASNTAANVKNTVPPATPNFFKRFIHFIDHPYHDTEQNP
jgi:hypothetical protein